MGVSKNRGTPKWMVYNGKPYQMDDYHYFRKHPDLVRRPTFFERQIWVKYDVTCILWHDPLIWLVNLLGETWPKAINWGSWNLMLHYPKSLCMAGTSGSSEHIWALRILQELGVKECELPKTTRKLYLQYHTTCINLLNIPFKFDHVLGYDN